MTVETQHPETLAEAVEAAIERGIALARREYGDDWYRYIDLDMLELNSAQFCILGQLETRRVEALPPDDPERERFVEYNAYSHAEVRLGLNDYDEEMDEKMAGHYGFLSADLPYDGLDEEGQQRRAYVGYATLTEAWRENIESLLANGHREV